MFQHHTGLWEQARKAFVKQMRRRSDEPDEQPKKASGLQRMFIQSADSRNLTALPGMNMPELFAALVDIGLTPTEEELQVCASER